MAFRKLRSLIERVNSTATSGGTLTLLNNSPTFQRFTGTLAHTVVLPNATTCPVGMKFVILNRSTGAITVNFDGGSLAATVDAGSQKTFRIVNNGTSVGTWDTSNEAGTAVTSLSDTEKLSVLAGLSNSRFLDGETSAKTIEINPEEVGASVWLAVSSYPVQTTNFDGFTLNGFGYGAQGFTTVDVNTTYRYDDDNNYWLQRANGANTRRANTCFVLEGFGFTNGGTSATSERYSDSLNAYTLRTAMPTNKAASSKFVFEDYGYIFGVSNATDAITYSYNNTANAWYTRANMNSAKETQGCGFQISDFGYVAGGSTTGGHAGATSITEQYDRASNVWRTSQGLLNTARWQTFNGAVNGLGYSVSGFNSAGVGITNAEQFDPSAKAWISYTNLNSARQWGSQFEINGALYVIAGSGVASGQVERLRNTSYLNIFLNKTSNKAPTSIFLAAAINNVTSALSAQIRTDGDNWKNLETNKAKVLRLDETLKFKFLGSPSVSVGGGWLAAGYSNKYENFNDITNAWTNLGTLSIMRGYPQGFGIEGYGYTVGGYDGANLTNNDRFDEILRANVTKAALPVAKSSGGGANLKGFGYVVSGATSDSLYKYDAAADSFTSMAILPAVRHAIPVAVLNERIYAIGGWNASQVDQTTVYVYSDITNSWSSAANLATAKGNNGATSLDGFAFLFGNSTATTAAEKYDPQANAWSAISAAPAARFGNGGASGFGYVFNIGGFDGTSTTQNTNYRYNTSSNTWDTRAVMTESKGVRDGSPDPGLYRNYQIRLGIPANILGLSGGAWVTKAASPVAIRNLAGFALNGFGFMRGGQRNDLGNVTTGEGYRYSDSLNAWKRIANLSDSRGYTGEFALSGFGYTCAGFISAVSAVVDRWDDEKSVSTVMTSVTTAGYNPFAGALNGFGYVAGGVNGAAISANNKYDPQANTWSAAANLPVADSGGRGASLNGGLYFFGGDVNPSPASTATYRYNDASNSYVTMTALTSGHSSRAGGTSNKTNLYMYGGYNASSAITAVSERFNDILNMWSVVSSLPNTRSGTGSFSINESIYAAAGYNGTADTTDNVAYVPTINKAVLGVALRVSE